jgi:hypothetical protein
MLLHQTLLLAALGIGRGFVGCSNPRRLGCGLWVRIRRSFAMEPN